MDAIRRRLVAPNEPRTPKKRRTYLLYTVHNGRYARATDFPPQLAASAHHHHPPSFLPSFPSSSPFISMSLSNHCPPRSISTVPTYLPNQVGKLTFRVTRPLPACLPNFISPYSRRLAFYVFLSRAPCFNFSSISDVAKISSVHLSRLLLHAPVSRPIP